MVVSEEQKSVAASVKWFKPDKGYGFVRFADGSGEAFLHASVLTSLGDVVLAEGMAIICDVAEGQKGPQVTAIHAVTPASGQEAKPRQRAARRGRQRAPEPGDDAPAAPAMESSMMVPSSPPPREARQRRPVETRAVSDELMLGSVRWYNLESQSGIIDPADGGEGVFFDRVTLRRSGLEIVADGEDVWFAARDTRDGLVAEHVELAPPSAH